MSPTPPYGYRRVKVKDGVKERAKLEPSPAIAWVVVKVFKMAVAGRGAKKIGKTRLLEKVESI